MKNIIKKSTKQKLFLFLFFILLKDNFIISGDNIFDINQFFLSVFGKTSVAILGITSIAMASIYIELNSELKQKKEYGFNSYDIQTMSIECAKKYPGNSEKVIECIQDLSEGTKFKNKFYSDFEDIKIINKELQNLQENENILKLEIYNLNMLKKEKCNEIYKNLMQKNFNIKNGDEFFKTCFHLIKK